MTRLIVISRDALGYKTKDKRSPFNTHPGVLRRLSALRIEGWRIAIASNESGGGWEESTAKHLVIGAQFRVKAECWFCDDFCTVKAIDIGRRGQIMKVVSHNHNWSFGPEEPILIRYKTIASTTAEIQSIADFCGITEAVFCPVLDGEILYALSYESGWGWRSKMITQKDSWKPGPGMLNYLKCLRTFKPRRRVMVGVNSEDYTAADRGGFEFFYGEDWRNDRVKV